MKPIIGSRLALHSSEMGPVSALSIVSAALIVALLLPQLSLAQDRAEPARGLLAVLKPGLKVNVLERNGWLEVSVLNEGVIGQQQVLEVGPGYLLVEDISGFSRRWISLSAVRSITWTRVPGATPPVPGRLDKDRADGR